MIETRIEQARGCGYRQPGGIYLIGGSKGQDCGRLPIPLTVCPCCNTGIKPSRGWTWVSPALLSNQCKRGETCKFCQSSSHDWTSQAKIGLIWIGESFYKTPSHFVAEAAMAGISRRLANVPHDFEIGQWVALAHRRTFLDGVNADGTPNYTPGVFMMFKPTAIEYIVTGTESPGRLDDLRKRGFKLVKVIRDIDTQMKLEDQLTEYVIKYQTTVEPVVQRVQNMRAVSKDVAKSQFKKSFPASKIISIK